MATIGIAQSSRLAALVAWFALVLAAAGCSGPVALHGVDYIPAFDTPDMNGGR